MKKSMKLCVILLGILLVISFLAGIGAVHIGQRAVKEQKTKKPYQRHYVMIVENPESEFWKSVYKSACNEAKTVNAYVELLGDNLTEDYKVSDFMEIAIAMKVDGILLGGNSDSKIKTWINQAEEAKIPVVTLMEDESGTKRESFVGINTYQLGEMYANEIYKLVKKRKTTVKVLYDTQMDTIENSMIYNQIKNVTHLIQDGTHNIQVTPYNIANGSVFEKEEAIRKIFLQPENVPDILVCMDETETEYVYQAIVDYNYVGKVSLVGYYHSQNILDAIKKGVVAASLEPDAEQMGKKSVTCLQEFYDTGYASDYYSVECNVITKQNADDYYENNEH